MLRLLVIVFSLSAEIFPTFWCMRLFLLAGIIAYGSGKAHVSILVILSEVLLLMIASDCWIAFCVMGCLAFSMAENNKIKKLLSYTLVRIIVAVVIFVAIKRPESLVAYYIDAICTFLFILLLETSDELKKILGSIKPLAFIGKYTMTIFMIHNGVYLLVAIRMFEMEMYQKLRYSLGFVIVFLVNMAIIMIVSIPLQYVLDRFSGLVRKRIRQDKLGI